MLGEHYLFPKASPIARNGHVITSPIVLITPLDSFAFALAAGDGALAGSRASSEIEA
jgi:hypothetical protein